MSRPTHTVVGERDSRHLGLHVTVMAYAGGTRFRAYLHTSDWRRLVAVSLGASPDEAAARADEVVSQALARGVAVSLPRQRSARRQAGDARAAENRRLVSRRPVAQQIGSTSEEV